LVAGGSLVIGADADVPTQAIPSDATDFVSISHGNDIDYYSFEVSQPGTLSAFLTPLGGEFTQSGEFDVAPTLFDANARSDLSLRLFDTNGKSTLVFVDDEVEGETESLEFELTTPGTYYARIEGLADTIQLYMLDLQLEAADVLGDCNGDGVVDGSDLDCACSAGLDTVLNQLDSLAGDFDLNGQVEFADFLVLSRSFGEEGDYLDGDVDCSGEVDFADFLAFAQSFGDTASAAAANVPEPSGQLLLSIAALVMSTRRRKRL
jgi:hypothetical protein